MGKTPGATSNSSQNSSQTTLAEPFGPAQESVNRILTEANTLYDTGGPQFYPDATYVPMSTYTDDGVYGLRNLAGEHMKVMKSPDYLDEAIHFLREMQGGDYAYTNSPVARYGTPFAQGEEVFANPAMNLYLQSLDASGNNPVFPALNEFVYGTPAEGDAFNGLGGGQNPFANAYLDTAMSRLGDQFANSTGAMAAFFNDDISNPGMQEQFRLNSRDFGDTLAQMERSIAMPLYESMMDRYLQGTLGYGQLYNQGQGLGLSAIGGLSGAYEGGVGRQLNAIGMLGQSYENDLARRMQAALSAPGFVQADFAPIDQMIRAGQITESYEDAALQDAINRFNFTQMSPYENLSRFGNYVMPIASGFPVTYSDAMGTSMSETEQRSNPFMQVAGMGLQAAPLLFL